MNYPPFISDPSLSCESIRHGFFTRHGGVSKGVYDSLNCGLGSQDDIENAYKNRRLAASAIGGENDMICGLYQVHSDICHIADDGSDNRPEGDAIVTNRCNLTLAILTADCVPVLFADINAGIIGAAHAGWRGAVKGITSSTIDIMIDLGANPDNIRAVIGPAIQQSSYQVGRDLRDEVLANHGDAEHHFIPDGDDKWKFDLPGFVGDRLSERGVQHTKIMANTYSDDRFFSHRQNTHEKGPDTGRLVSMIRIND